MNAKQVKDIITRCLDEMYRNSEPPITWAEIQTKYENVDNWFWKHEIDENRYEEIRDKYRQQLSQAYRSSLDWELLNYAPKFKKVE